MGPPLPYQLLEKKDMSMSSSSLPQQEAILLFLLRIHRLVLWPKSSMQLKTSLMSHSLSRRIRTIRCCNVLQSTVRIWTQSLERTLEVCTWSHLKKKVIKAIAENISSKYFISTSQAVDIIHGGLKINALPEEVVTEVNHRIIYGSSIGQIREKVLRAVRPVAKRFGLSIDAFGVRMEFGDSTPLGKVTLTTYDGLQTAPVTPIENNPTWKLLSGTIRHVFEDSKTAFNVNQKPIFVAPSIMSGNTDTRHYWNLTKNIYRFNPIRGDYSYNIHAIDERVHLDAHLETVAFFYDFVRNADQIR